MDAVRTLHCIAHFRSKTRFELAVGGVVGHRIKSHPIKLIKVTKFGSEFLNNENKRAKTGVV